MRRVSHGLGWPANAFLFLPMSRVILNQKLQNTSAPTASNKAHQKKLNLTSLPTGRTCFARSLYRWRPDQGKKAFREFCCKKNMALAGHPRPCETRRKILGVFTTTFGMKDPKDRVVRTDVLKFCKEKWMEKEVNGENGERSEWRKKKTERLENLPRTDRQNKIDRRFPQGKIEVLEVAPTKGVPQRITRGCTPKKRCSPGGGREAAKKRRSSGKDQTMGGCPTTNKKKNKKKKIKFSCLSTTKIEELTAGSDDLKAHLLVLSVSSSIFVGEREEIWNDPKKSELFEQKRCSPGEDRTPDLRISQCTDNTSCTAYKYDALTDYATGETVICSDPTRIERACMRIDCKEDHSFFRFTDHWSTDSGIVESTFHPYYPYPDPNLTKIPLPKP